MLAATLASTPLQAADTGPVASPPSARERIDLAREAIRKQDWRRALDELNRAVREEPHNADIHNLLGYSLRKQARPDLPRAFEHYRKAIELDPRHKGAHEYIGEAYLMDRKPQEAEKHLAALQQICGNTTCEEYVDLAKAIADYRLKN
ncbi:MAG: tetratricopeptide repeat protein [Rhodoferax sp.]|nr:tetratricopeptide repeat protein [Rhodoferax sp.]